MHQLALRSHRKQRNSVITTAGNHEDLPINFDNLNIVNHAKACVQRIQYVVRGGEASVTVQFHDAQRIALGTRNHNP